MSKAPTNWITNGLRSLLRFLLSRPGNVFQPVVIEYTPSGSALEHEVKTLAAELDVAFYARLEEIRLAAFDQRAVLLVPIVDLASAEPSFLESLPGNCQVLAWTTGGLPDLPPELAAWVEQGLRYRIRIRSSPDERQYDSFAGTVGLCLRKPGREYNPLVVVAPAERCDDLAADVAIRCSAVGLPVIEQRAPFDASVFGPREMPPPRSVVVVRMMGYSPDDDLDGPFMYALEQALSVPVQIVVLLDPSTEEELRKTPRWMELFDRGVRLSLLLPRDQHLGLEEADESVWPPLRAVLAGRPMQLGSSNRVLEGSLSKLSLADALQFVSMGGRTGRLILFSPSAYGYIDFRDGRIVHAGPAKQGATVLEIAEVWKIEVDQHDAFRDLAERVVRERILAMSDWQDARFVFVGRSVQPPLDETVDIDPQGLALDVARQLDEWPRVVHRVGGLERIWRRLDDVSPPEGGLAFLLWNEMDGTKTLGEVILRLGVGRFDAASAVESLVGNGRIVFVRDSEAEVSVDVEETVSALWSEGLVSEVESLCETAQMQGYDSPLLAYYQAWVRVENGDWQAAIRFFEIAGQSDDREDAACARINALLLRLRLGELDPQDAFVSMQENGLFELALKAPPEGIAELLPACAEICVRAGRQSEADAALEQVHNPEVQQRLQAARI